MTRQANTDTLRPQIDLKAVANLMARVGLLECESFGSQKDEAYFDAVRSVALGIFKLVVMGEIKKGKSSFINGICGTPNLVPVNSDIATSTVFKIHHGGEQQYTVYFERENPEDQYRKREISRENVEEYGTENGNRANHKRVEFIGVASPAPILSNGLIILDTPGVGGLFKKHRDITFKHAPKADAIFFVTDSTESPIGADEVAFLKDLRRVTNLIFFVQTKAAKVSEDACRRRMENNIEILILEANFAREDIRYFVVDSGLKADADKARNFEDLDDSGFVPVMQFLTQDLKRKKDQNLAFAGLSRARKKLESVRAQVTHRRRLLDANTAEKQKELADEVLRSEKTLQEWATKQKGPLLLEFQQTLSTDISEIQTAFQLDLKPGGRIADALAKQLESAIQRNSAGAEEVYALAPGLVQEARASASESLILRIRELETKISSLLEMLSTKAGAQILSLITHDCVPHSLNDATVLSLSDLRLTPPEHTIFTTLRNASMGATAAAGVASVIGGVVGSVVPVVGTLIGGTLGVILAAAWGGKEALDFAKKQEVAAARREVLAALDRELGNLIVRANSEFSKTVRSLEAKAREAVQNLVEQCQKRFSDQRRAVQDRAKSNRTLIEQEQKVVKSLEVSISEIEHQIAAHEAALHA